MDSLLKFTFAELKQKCIEMRYPAHSAYQIFNWLYRKFSFSFDSMSDIPKKMRGDLNERFGSAALSLKDALCDSGGETVKFLFETADREHIESVLIFADDT